MTSCDGCLGSRQCWVCNGQGRLRTLLGPRPLCSVCHGTAVCQVCLGAPLPAPRANEHDQPERAES